MKSIRALTTPLLLIAAASTIGCAIGSVAPRDLRSSAQLASDAPSILVSGPALLMHVDVDNPGADLVLYAVARNQGSAADCGVGPTGDSVRLHAGRTNPVNVVIPADQAACVASEGALATVHWHARRSEKPLGADAAQLLALGAHDRAHDH